MLESIKDFCKTIGDKIGLSGDIVMWGGLGIIVLVVFLAIFIPVMICTKRKKKARILTQQVVAPVKEENTTDLQVEAQAVVPEVNQTIEESATVEQTEEIKEQTVEQAPKVQEKVSKTQNKTTKKATAKKVEKPVKKLNGKWVIEIKRASEYVARLTASNGEVMLYSETYTTEDGARNGISTIINGIENGKFVFYQDKNSNHYFKIKTSTNRLICVGEIYKSKDQCIKASETVKRIASGSTIQSELFEGARYVEYTPATLDEQVIAKSLRGKWKVETVADGKFSAHLYASNGQLMLATEEVALKKSAEKAIDSVKKNATEGNFIIDRDKFGRYYYKLRNAQKTVICIGEAYDSLDSCTSAIESVRRFAINSPTAE